MTRFPWTSRTHRSDPAAGAFDALLSGSPLPADLPDIERLAYVLAAVAAPALPSELAGEAAALAAFHDPGRAPRRVRIRRTSVLSTLLTAKLATIVAASGMSVVAVTAAAYTTHLPRPLQQAAHDTIGAPAPHAHHDGDQVEPTVSETPDPSHSATPVGPDATGAAAYGLCNAYTHASAHGSAADKSVAFRNLATAAGGVDQIDAYCATIPHPGHSGSPRSGHPTGKPSAHPSHHHTPSHPTGKPSTHPSHPTTP